MVLDQIQDDLKEMIKLHKYRSGYKNTANGRMYREIYFEDKFTEIELAKIKAKYSTAFF